MPRPYDDIAEKLRALEGSRHDRMQAAANILWDALAPTGISWVGFYLAEPNADEMILGPCRDKPACSPIGLHGACGRSWQSQRALVIADVASLGEQYIACDPRDRSELVIPLFDAGACWGVLDLDSHDLASFSTHDAEQLNRLMAIAGLTTDQPREDPIVL